MLPPKELVEWDPRLSAREKLEVAGYGSAVFVRAEPRTGDVLKDRKLLLRWLEAVMGPQGLFAIDSLAQSCWSRQALQDELQHDAAVDISALFTIHMITGAGQDVYWLHSHGLQEIGHVDFDLVAPNPSCYQEGYDGLRGLAFAIVEGAVAADGGDFDLAHPGGSIRLVSARRFLAEAAPDECTEWRATVDEAHLERHAIVCDPAGRSFFGFGRKSPRASRFFARPFPEKVIVRFSNEASALMGERARNTYPSFRSLREEFAEFSLPVLVKLGYVVDGGGEREREHLWFEVHGCGEQEIDATLVNQPFQIARMRQGERAMHPAGLLSDWAILTPFGRITPAFGMALREVRGRKEELRGILAGTNQAR